MVSKLYLIDSSTGLQKGKKMGGENLFKARYILLTMVFHFRVSNFVQNTEKELKNAKSKELKIWD